MLVKEIDFKGRQKPKDVTNLQAKMTRGWSVPIAFPVPIRFNGVLCTHFNISNYGAIRMTQAKAKGYYHYWDEDKYLPASIDETDKGYMIIPWGEPMNVWGCGTSLIMWEANGTVVIEYKTKSTYDPQKVYMFRVEFPVREHNIVRVYYYHCVSGYDTYVGAILEPDDFVNWPMKPVQPYMKKALEFTCETTPEPVEPKPNGKPTKEPVFGYEWSVFHSPMGDIWKQTKIQAIGEDWEILYEDAKTKLLTR